MYATLMQADYSHEDAIDAVLPLRRLGQLLQAPRRLEGRAAGQKRCGDNEIISGSGGAKKIAELTKLLVWSADSIGFRHKTNPANNLYHLYGKYCVLANLHINTPHKVCL